MTGYLIREYFGAFRRRQGKTGYAASFWPIYYFVFMAVMQRKGEGIVWTDLAVQLALLLPMMFVYRSAMAHPPGFPKMMYLCPMDGEERRRYARASYGLRAGIHMLVCVLGLGIVVPYSFCDRYSVLLILANDFSISVLLCHSDGRVPSPRKTQDMGGAQEERKVGGATVRGQILFICALLSNLVQYGILMDEAPDMGVKLALVLCFCLVQLPLGIRYGKDIRNELEAAVSYEPVWRSK